MKYGKHRAESGVASRRGTDEEPIALLQTKGMSAVEVSVVCVPFRESITKQCIEFMAMLS